MKASLSNLLKARLAFELSKRRTMYVQAKRL